MNNRKTIVKTPTAQYGKALSARLKEKYVLRLYITGATGRSLLALANLKKICKEHLDGRCDLEVIDLYQYPALASDHQIIAAPTLLKKSPLPVRRIVGDMSNAEKVLKALDLL